MTAQHTPGPWQWDGNVCDYDESNEAPWLVTDAYAVGIEKELSKGVVLRGGIKCRSEADARLIAAAPDLLEVARHALEQTDPHSVLGVRLAEVIAKVEAP
jgi:hypothetical protein